MHTQPVSIRWKTSLLSLVLAVMLLLSACGPAQPVQTAAQANQSPAAAGVTQPPAEKPAQPATAQAPNASQTGSQAAATAPGQPSPAPASPAPTTAGLSYPVVDTGQSQCYDNAAGTACPNDGAAFSGQDAQYAGSQPRYQDNGDGTVTDLVTGLMWQQDPGDKKTYTEAVAGAAALDLGGYSDWRLPTIKELYSLILFDGTDVSACMRPGNAAGSESCSATPFVDTRYFGFEYGDTGAGERIIDAQYWSSSEYGATTMNGSATVFGVNFADGRIKGYPRDTGPRGEAFTEFTRYVRGNPNYGLNSFSSNGDSTITDSATGLTWMQADSGRGLNWQEALAFCEASTAAGYDDWRLPDAKELQSIVDTTRSPAATGTPAIDPLFSVTAITAENGQTDFPFYWASTTHADSNGGGSFAVYLSFGTAFGYMSAPGSSGSAQLTDVHGAGAQRSDPKTGDASQYPQGHGPQGDVVRVQNYARCVRGGSASYTPQGSPALNRPAQPVQSSGLQPGQGNMTGGQSGGQGGMAGGQPPQEAIAACSGQTQGAACQVNTPNGALNGACQSIQNQLACVPAGGPGNQPGQDGGMFGGPPPQEAIAACSGQTQAAACSFTAPNGAAISGACQSIQNQFVCVPAGGPPAARP